MKEFIAYRDKDSEGDIWCENCFMFTTNEEARDFFSPTNPDLINIYTDEDDKEIRDFEIYDDNPAKLISRVSFSTEYAGNVNIYLMSKGYLCSKE